MLPRPSSMFRRQRAASEAAFVVLTARAEVIVTGRVIDAPELSMTATKVASAPAMSQRSRINAAPTRVPFVLIRPAEGNNVRMEFGVFSDLLAERPNPVHDPVAVSHGSPIGGGRHPLRPCGEPVVE